MQYRHATFLLFIIFISTGVLTVAVFQRRAALEEVEELERIAVQRAVEEEMSMPALVEGQYRARSADLDGDGAAESVSLSIRTGAEFGTVRTLTVNGLSVDIVNDGNSAQPYFGIVDLNSADTFKEIALSDWGPSSDDTTVFYGWQNGALVHLGTTSDLWENMMFAGDGTFQADVRASVLDTWFYRETFKRVGTTIVDVPQEFYTRRDPALVTMTGSLNLYVSPGNTTVIAILAPGDTGTIVGCTSADDASQSWCKLVPVDGVEGWFAVQNTSADLFEGLSFADEVLWKKRR